jgi:hypothetical protein
MRIMRITRSIIPAVPYYVGLERHADAGGLGGRSLG